MPVQSCLLPVPFDIANSTLVIQNYPTLATDVVRNYLSQTSPLIISLDPTDIHYAGHPDRFALDHNLAAAFWYTIKRIARLIYRAANPGLDTWNLSAGIPEARLHEIGVGYPEIVNSLSATQNPCMLLGSRQEITDTFAAMQKWGLSWLQWAVEARVLCTIHANGWKWDSAPNELFPATQAITVDHSAHALEWLDSSARITDPSHLIEWYPESNQDSSLALIVHPNESNAARAACRVCSGYNHQAELCYPINKSPIAYSAAPTVRLSSFDELYGDLPQDSISAENWVEAWLNDQAEVGQHTGIESEDM